jgi:hypothetical protein
MARSNAPTFHRIAVVDRGREPVVLGWDRLPRDRTLARLVQQMAWLERCPAREGAVPQRAPELAALRQGLFALVAVRSSQPRQKAAALAWQLGALHRTRLSADVRRPARAVAR